jgi:hypothetical protein
MFSKLFQNFAVLFLIKGAHAQGEHFITRLPFSYQKNLISTMILGVQKFFE